MSDKIKELNDIVNIILNEKSHHFELLNGAQTLGAFFEQYSHILRSTPHYEIGEDGKHIYLSNGIAISPLDAAICVNEYMRTTKYIRGIFQAIKDLMNNFENEEIHLLYAGSGPYGTLIIPILSFFDPKRLKVTFLDINSSSLKSVEKIIDSLNLQSYINEYVQADATTYKCEQKTHIIVTETMKAAFDNEPQVAITLNLLPQLCENGVFIPERVSVNFEMIYKRFENSNDEENLLIMKRESDFLCEVIDLDTRKKVNRDNMIVTKKYTISKEIDKKKEPFLCTDIYIYKNNILRENECSLNIPKKLKFDRELKKSDEIEFYYEFGKMPQIKYSFI